MLLRKGYMFRPKRSTIMRSMNTQAGSKYTYYTEYYTPTNALSI